MIRAAALFCALLCTPQLALPQALPEGLEGLGDLSSDGPILDTSESAGTDQVARGVRVSGFAEALYGARLQDDPLQGDATLSELRFHLDVEAGRDVLWTLSADLIADAIDHSDFDLATGDGAVDIREAHVFFRPTPDIDVRLGRQILTWGTGDLLFVNDLFPKDFESLVAGRDDDYLKAPADALRISGYSDLVNADLVVMAPGQTDRIVTGERLSYTDAVTGQATNVPPQLDRNEDVDVALRLHRTFGSVEAALYGYAGHWKSPAGQDSRGVATFPGLTVLGASLRAPVLGGIGYAEIGAYRSDDDVDGTDPRVANSELRSLLGYEREVARDTTLGVQYAVTQMDNHGSYLAGLPTGAVASPETRDVATLRLTRLMFNQTVTASVFALHSPGQEDGFLRARIDYAVSDTWSVGLNGTMFYGDRDTAFGQFSDANSVGVSIRASF